MVSLLGTRQDVLWNRLPQGPEYGSLFDIIPWTGSFTDKGIKAYGLNNQSALGVVGIPGTQADAATIVVVVVVVVVIVMVLNNCIILS